MLRLLKQILIGLSKFIYHTTFEKLIILDYGNGMAIIFIDNIGPFYMIMQLNTFSRPFKKIPSHNCFILKR